MTLTIKPRWNAENRRQAQYGVLDALPEAIDPLALARNESPFPPLSAVRTALIHSIDAANRYPPFLPEALRSLIAERIGVRKDQVVLGAGATGVMLQLLHALTDPRDPIVMADPTFEGHPIVARICDLAPMLVPLNEDGHHDLAAMAAAASQARVVVVCRPHNPTGTVESAAAMEQFLCRTPRETVVVIDEAYCEFVASRYRIDAVALVQRFPNVVVLRTFSKAYGLAGLRIGYVFGSTQLAAKIWAMQLPFGMGITSLVAVAASYGAEAQLRQRIRSITAERRTLQTRLRTMGVCSTDSHANFIFLPAAGRPWRDAFDHAGVSVRHYPDGAERITIGGHASTRAVLSAVRGL